MKTNMKERFQHLAGIKEVTPVAPTTTSTTTPVATSVTNIAKDLNDQDGNFENIKDRIKVIQLLDAVVVKLDPKFKESPVFKKAILDFYNKYNKIQLLKHRLCKHPVLLLHNQVVYNFSTV